MFMLLAGRLDKCWNLSAAACGVYIALGGQYLADLASKDNHEEAMEIRYCLSLSYMFDKAISMSIDRAPCLPEMDLDLVLLMPNDLSRPFTALVNTFMEIAKVQEQILRSMGTQATSSVRVEKIQELQRMMWQIGGKMKEVIFLL